MIHLEQMYRQALAMNAGLGQSLTTRRADFTLFAFLEALASREGLKGNIEYMRPSVKSLDDGHQEEQVEMRLNGVTLAGIIPYLYHVETAPEQVHVKRLTIRPQQRDQSLLDVNLVIVTYVPQETSTSTAKETSHRQTSFKRRVSLSEQFQHTSPRHSVIVGFHTY
jgi:hypothetical protein